MLEKVIVLYDESLFPICSFNRTPVVDFPEAQTKGIGSTVSFPHGVSDFQWISHDDDRSEPRQQLVPERQGQAITRILPPPNACRIEFFDKQPSFKTQRIESRARDILVGFGRQVPCPAKLTQQLVV